MFKTHFFYLIKKMPVTDDYALEWSLPDKKEVLRLLVDEYDFGSERVESILDSLLSEKEKQEQKGLGDWV